MNHYKSACFVALSMASVSNAEARRPEIKYFVSPAGAFQLLEPGFERSPPATTDDASEEQSGPPLDGAFGSMGGEPAAASPVDLTRTLKTPAWMRQDSRPPTPSLNIPAVTSLALQNCGAARYAPHPALNSAQELRRQRYFNQMAKAACGARVPVELFDALIIQESRYNPLALSPKGASGLSQLMPETARSLGVFDRWNVSQNLLGGARYLRKQLDTFGNWALALGAYNAGPGNVTKYGGVPPFKETRAYVRTILSSINAYQQSQGLFANSAYGPQRGVMLTSFTD